MFEPFVDLPQNFQVEVKRWISCILLMSPCDIEVLRFFNIESISFAKDREDQDKTPRQRKLENSEQGWKT